MYLTTSFGLLFAAIASSTLAIETTRESEGLPNGYLSDCPGSTKPVRITKKSLRKLTLVHMQKAPSYLVANKTNYQSYQMGVLAKNLNLNSKTLLYVNGYLDSPNNLNFMTPVMGDLYTQRGYNALLLEYAQFSSYYYPVAARILRAVGLRVAEMLADLTKHGLDPKKLELLGISHGGQAISFIGKNFKRITGKTIGRITALDPAGPCFRRRGPEDRIDASDADRVDIVHTNNEGYGFTGAVGHVNFYVNGGEYQQFDIDFLPCESFCSHTKSYLVWVTALMHPELFIAVKCDSIQDARDRTCFDRPLVTNLLGPKTDFNKTGIFHLITKNNFPYGVGKKGIQKDYDAKLDWLAKINKDDVIVV